MISRIHAEECPSPLIEFRMPLNPRLCGNSRIGATPGEDRSTPSLKPEPVPLGSMLPESRFYVSQRLKMHYVVWGDEAKPPLILVHGTRDHARSWDRVAEALSDRYCIYAPDLRGHGDSAWALGGNYSIIDYALDIHALGEAIGRAPYTVIGHSLGGGVSLQYAGTFP